MEIASAVEGSSIITFWKRRSSALSCSKYFWYSSKVVAPMVRSSPLARAGLRMLGSIHGTLTLTGTYKGMYLVDEEEYLAFGSSHLLYDGFEPLLELALILRAGDQRSHVEREYLFAAQVFGYVAVHDTAGDALRDGRLAHARLADEDGCCFSSCAKESGVRAVSPRRVR